MKDEDVKNFNLWIDWTIKNCPPNKWYTYREGDFKKTFYCVAVDRYILLANVDLRYGYCSWDCSEATEEEIKNAKII